MVKKSRRETGQRARNPQPDPEVNNNEHTAKLKAALKSTASESIVSESTVSKSSRRHTAKATRKTARKPARADHESDSDPDSLELFEGEDTEDDTSHGHVDENSKSAAPEIWSSSETDTDEDMEAPETY